MRWPSTGFWIALGLGFTGVMWLAGTPRLIGARLNANETAAIATMRNLHSAQEQFHATIGRFGTFLELSGVTALPETGSPLDPPVLSRAFSRPLPDGTILRSGYRFRIVVDAGTWCAWSWPEKRMAKQRRTFYVGGAVGDTVHATEIEDHEGNRGPADGDDGVWAVVHGARHFCSENCPN